MNRRRLELFLTGALFLLDYRPDSWFPILVCGLGSFWFSGCGFLCPCGRYNRGIITFWVARKFGRPAVIRLVGERSMARVDQFSEEVGWQLLVIFLYLSLRLGFIGRRNLPKSHLKIVEWELFSDQKKHISKISAWADLVASGPKSS